MSAPPAVGLFSMEIEPDPATPLSKLTKTIMKSTFQQFNGLRFSRVFTEIRLLVGLFCASDLHAQTPEEHASQHPGGAAPAAGAMPAAGGASPEPGGMGGMMEWMAEMIKGMMSGAKTIRDENTLLRASRNSNSFLESFKAGFHPMEKSFSKH